MHETDPNLAEKLAHADEASLREVIREAECFLQSQLQAALASDQRAMTFAGILAAAIAIIVGACVSLMTVDKDKIEWIVFAVAPMVACLTVALHYAAHAARPTKFDYAGNDPDEWSIDIESAKPFCQSLAEQAALYSRDIRRNSEIMKRNCDHVRSSIGWAFAGVLIGTATTIFTVTYVLWPFARG